MGWAALFALFCMAASSLQLAACSCAGRHACLLWPHCGSSTPGSCNPLSCSRQAADTLAQGGLPPPCHPLLDPHRCAAKCCPNPPIADDELLTRWRKVDAPFLHLPPADLQLTGWRDPYIFTTNTAAAPSELCAAALGSVVLG